MSHGVPWVARGLQLFVNRRGFRPLLEVGTANRRTTKAYLEALQAELAGFESSAWMQTTVSLLFPAESGPDEVSYKTYRDIPLGDAAPH